MLYYTIPQAAKLLGRTRQDVWYLVKKQRIKSFKIGRLYVITQEELKSYLINKMTDKTNNGDAETALNNNIIIHKSAFNNEK